MTAVTEPRVAGFPLWLANVDATLPVTPQYILHGNLRDLFLLPDGNGGRTLAGLQAALWQCLRASGFGYLLWYQPHGLTLWPPRDADAQRMAARATGGSQIPATVERADLPNLISQVATDRTANGAIVLDYVSQWQPSQQPPDATDHALMQRSLSLVHNAIRVPSQEGSPRAQALYNPVFWLVDVPGDLPSWLSGGSDGIRQVAVPRPDLDARKECATLLVRSLAPSDQAQDAIADAFANSTEGMTLRAMFEIVQLALDRGLPAPQITDAVRAYRIGLLDNPWAKRTLRERITLGSDLLGKDILGQQRAVHHAVDILTRSTTGMTSAHLKGGSTGPRGVMFFAGPTGVGKTELAKAITRLVFGDERAYIRLDMSEFASEHTEARLIGSPPGYVGHGAGGELTNAVRQRPHSVVLFDEVEKAHPRILDKFLQILSDGRLTDGSGDTVYFSESIIVFTSNLGVPPLKEGEDVPRGEEFVRQVIDSVRRFFTDEIGRPELLGRIGDNIVVFDYIDAETTGRQLADRFIDNVVNHAVKATGIAVRLAPATRRAVSDLAIRDLSKGGRGIGLTIEKVLVNPLARALLRHEPSGVVQVTGIRQEGDGWYELELA